MAEWYERWFGEEYLALYPHRDERDAAAAVALLERQLGAAAVRPAEQNGKFRILDLACGAGRHMRLLDKFGWSAGLDLSPVLLRLARRSDPHGAYVRADMRVLPFADESFALVTNLFTSFGYFEMDEEHGRVLQEVRRVLRPGGTFMLDFFNAAHVRRNLVPYDEREVGGTIVQQHRSISPDGRYVLKRIVVTPDGRTFVERVRLFERQELAHMLEGAGFRNSTVFGNYAGAAATDEAPRAIFFAVRA
jgi:ubiquinone/menaquinone biosynthesis C-methylase UbiE